MEFLPSDQLVYSVLNRLCVQRQLLILHNFDIANVYFESNFVRYSTWGLIQSSEIEWGYNPYWIELTSVSKQDCSKRCTNVTITAEIKFWLEFKFGSSFCSRRADRLDDNERGIIKPKWIGQNENFVLIFPRLASDVLVSLETLIRFL